MHSMTNRVISLAMLLHREGPLLPLRSLRLVGLEGDSETPSSRMLLVDSRRCQKWEVGGGRVLIVSGTADAVS